MKQNYKVDSIGFYDEREVYRNCTVEILKNSVTGEVSVGWYKEGEYPEEDDDNE